MNFLKDQFQQILRGGISILFYKVIKFIKILIVFFLSIFFLPISFIVLLISKFIFIRFSEIPTNRIGHFAGEVDLYLTNLKLKEKSQERKFLDIFCVQYYDNFICNKSLFKEVKKKMYIFPSINIYQLILNCKYYKIFSKHVFQISRYKDRDVENIIYNTPANLTFSEKDNLLGEEFLYSITGSKKTKFVTLIVRDKAYLNKYYNTINKYFKKDWSYHDYRDGNIDNCVPACEELTKLGYYVFRMGHVVEKKINTRNPKIIDYATNGMRNEFLDLFLASRCEFCITNGVGWDAVPQIYRKPMLFINCIPLTSIFTSAKKFMITVKHHYSKNLNRNLSLKEIFNYNLAEAYNSTDYSDKNIIVKENDAHEICNAVLEMETFVKNSEFKYENFCKFNKKFWEIYIEMNRKLNLESYHGKLLSRISKSFIRNNNYLLS